MKFLNDYKDGGDRADKTGKMGGYIYLSKKDEQDLLLEVRKVFIKPSENPKHPGKEKGIFVFAVAEIYGTTQEDLEVGDEVSFMIDLQPSNDMAVEPARGEFINVLSACTRTTARDYWKNLNGLEAGGQSLVEEHLEDDCQVAQGNFVRVETLEKPNKGGWYNLTWTEVEEAPKKSKAKKAS